MRGRVALITGPAKGMGATITQAFAAEGCLLALVGRDTAAIGKVADAVRADGGQAIVLGCDLTDAAQCEAAAQAALAQFGRIDILVNVAVRVRPDRQVRDGNHAGPSSTRSSP